MNFYEHHLGDYMRDTAHLTMVEDGAYRRLLDAYYIREGALPSDLKACQKLARAHAREEREAVVAVLAEFFVLQEDGYHQLRADEVIAGYREGEPVREAKRVAAAERQRRARARRAELFDALRQVGIVPDFDASTRELESQLSRVTSRVTGASVTRKDTATSPQSPVPSPQSPCSDPSDPRVDARARDAGIVPRETLSEPEIYQRWQRIMALYPTPIRADWVTAEKGARRIVLEGEATWDYLEERVTHYAQLCAATNRIPLNPARWFNDADKPWAQPWPIPVSQGQQRQDANVAASEEFLRRMGAGNA